MIKRTVKEIAEKVEELWIGRDAWRQINIEVQIDPVTDIVKIDLFSMYSAPGLKFSHLKALSEFFETENINDDEAFNETGCETCDYGSKYGYTLTIRP